MPTPYSFTDDYSEGAHPEILRALLETNLVQQAAYGTDQFTAEAIARIQAQLGPGFSGDIHFVASGTLANLVSIAACLRPHEAVITAQSGHIVGREAGAIEATGHKLITVPAVDGKLTPAHVESALAANAHFPHMARPRLLYLSNATEIGTLYTLAELQALSALARQRGLLLFIDGARLGAALASPHNDVTLADIAALADLFWIGGTKAGALLGEAIVVCHPSLKPDFAIHIKQRGGLLAKGRLLGTQFKVLFGPAQAEAGDPAGADLLYTALARHANAMAAQLAAGIVAHGHALSARVETNQVFPILPDALITRLQERFSFHPWGPASEPQHSVIRLVTSWATVEGQVAGFLEGLGAWPGC